jgi:hypothetical protein
MSKFRKIVEVTLAVAALVAAVADVVERLKGDEDL